MALLTNISEEKEEEYQKYGVPYAEYKEMRRLYLEAMKAKVDSVFQPKVKEQFSQIAELFEQGILTGDEALEAVKRVIRQHEAVKASEAENK